MKFIVSLSLLACFLCLVLICCFRMRSVYTDELLGVYRFESFGGDGRAILRTDIGVVVEPTVVKYIARGEWVIASRLDINFVGKSGAGDLSYYLVNMRTHFVVGPKCASDMAGVIIKLNMDREIALEFTGFCVGY